ncbi:hypothetical protein BH10BAC4_BH10BAC4_07610 [soil metagenome]
MPTQIGVGFSKKADSFAAGQQVATKAMAGINSSTIDLVLTFCNGKHDPHQFLAGVRSVTFNAPLLGGAAMGVFTNSDLSYEEYESSVTVFSSDTIQFKIFREPGLDKDEYATGIGLATQIKNADVGDDRGLLVFYDTIKNSVPARYNHSTSLFDAMETIIDKNICFAAGGMVGDLQRMQCFQFFNDEVISQHAMALVIGGKCQMRNTTIHGCRPSSSYKTITKTEGPMIYEIDNRPALEVIQEMFAGKKVSWDEFPFFVTLGRNKGDKYGEPKREDYVNRMCLAVDKEKKALVMTNPDFKAGDDVQIMHINIDFDYLHQEMDALKIATGNEKLLYYFYIDCIGRAKPFTGGDLEDAAEVQRKIDNKIPLMGFYTGAEVSKVQNEIRSMVWTGVLCLLTE